MSLKDRFEDRKIGISGDAEAAFVAACDNEYEECIDLIGQEPKDYEALVETELD